MPGGHIESTPGDRQPPPRVRILPRCLALRLSASAVLPAWQPAGARAWGLLPPFATLPAPALIPVVRGTIFGQALQWQHLFDQQPQCVTGGKTSCEIATEFLLVFSSCHISVQNNGCTATTKHCLVWHSWLSAKDLPVRSSITPPLCGRHCCINGSAACLRRCSACTGRAPPEPAAASAAHAGQVHQTHRQPFCASVQTTQ